MSATAALVAGSLLGTASASQATTSLPCDIYAAAGTPCVPAHSTVRALYAAYSGPLYQVKRASDSTTLNIGTLTAGGYANAAAQNTFCAGTSCTITEIFDQSPEHNNLTIEGPGGNGGQDVGASAAALPVMAGGHQVYGLFVTAGVGYRHNSTTGVATGASPQGEYMVASGTHVNGGCCFAYGNAETNSDDNGNGHMDAINFSTECWFAPCSGSGPWVQADLENGLFAGANGSDTSNKGNPGTFVTALVKNNGTTTYAIKGGNAQSGGLTTWYNGALPDLGGYAPMHQEGAIVLGTGGDNSKSSIGSFFEGVMTAGYPTDAADNAVQANIVSVGYALPTGGAGTIVAGDDSADCADNNNGSATPGNKVQMWTCDGNAGAQNWTVASNGTLQIDGGCMDITGAKFVNGTLIEWWTCNGGTNQVWQAVNGELVNPASGMCLDDPGFNTTPGTQLVLWTCNGGTNGYLRPAQGRVRGRCGGPVRVAGHDRAAGKVAGPYDWRDGLTYWVWRAARGGRVAVPGDPQQPVQVIDSRDLGGLVVRLLADDRSGAFSRSRPGRADHDRRAHPDLRPGGGYPGRDSTGAARNGTPAVPPDQDGLAVTATQPGPS